MITPRRKHQRFRFSVVSVFAALAVLATLVRSGTAGHDRFVDAKENLRARATTGTSGRRSNRRNAIKTRILKNNNKSMRQRVRVRVRPNEDQDLTSFATTGDEEVSRSRSLGEEITVDWYIPSGDSLLAITVNVGDTIIFKWSAGFHNVFLHPSGTCDTTGAIEVAGASAGPDEARFTFDYSHTMGSQVFACDVGTHCEEGMIMTVRVLEGPTFRPVPSPTPTFSFPPTNFFLTQSPTPQPTVQTKPTLGPTEVPTFHPDPTQSPTQTPTESFQTKPTLGPTDRPTQSPTPEPTPTLGPTEVPTFHPDPTQSPTQTPTDPTVEDSNPPTSTPLCPYDLPCTAKAATIGEPLAISTTGCTMESETDIPYFYVIDNSAWMVFEAPASGCAEIDYDFDGVPTGDVSMALYSSSSCDSFPFSQMFWSDDVDGQEPRITITDRRLSPGRQYWVMVDGVNGANVDGFLTVTDPCDSTTCINDSPCLAVELSISGDRMPISTVGCHSESETLIPFSGTISNSAYASFRAPESGCVLAQYQYEGGSGTYDTDTELGLYAAEGCDAFPFTQLAYYNNYDSNPYIRLDNRLLTPGKRYYIMVDGVYGDETYGTIEVTDPCLPDVCPHDSPCSAAEVMVDGEPVFISTIGCHAFSETLIPFRSSASNTAFVTFVAPESGCATIDFDFLSGVFYYDDDVEMSLYEADSCDDFPFTELEYSDDVNGDDPRIIVDYLSPGKQYWVMIDGRYGDRVNGTIEVTDHCGPNACPNDLPCDAVHAEVGGPPVNISTVSCTSEVLGTTTTYNSAWLSFVAGESGCAQINFTYVGGEDGDDRTDMYLYTASNCSSPLFQWMSYYDVWNGNDRRLTVDDRWLKPGKRYWVRLDGGYRSEQVYGEIQISDPCNVSSCPHDSPCSAVEGVVGGGPIELNTIGCNSDLSGTYNSAFMTFVAPPSGAVEIDYDITGGISYWDNDAEMRLYEATSCDAPTFTQLSWSDDYNSYEPRIIYYGLTAGQRYWVAVYGDYGDRVNGTIEVFDPTAPGERCPYDQPCDAVMTEVGGGPVEIATVGCTGESVGSDFTTTSAFAKFVAPASGCASLNFTFIRGDEPDDEYAELALIAADDCNSTLRKMSYYTSDSYYSQNKSIVVNDRWLKPGRMYWLMVSGRYGDQVYGEVEVGDPCGNECPYDSPCTAAETSVGAGPVYMSLAGCHQAPRSEIPGYYSSAPTAFLKFVAPASGCAELDWDMEGYASYSYDVAMVLFSASSCDGNFTQLEFNDDFDQYEPRITRFDLNPGETYYAMIYNDYYYYRYNVSGTLEVTDPCDPNRCANGSPCSAAEAVVDGGPVDISTVGCRVTGTPNEDDDAYYPSYAPNSAPNYPSSPSSPSSPSNPIYWRPSSPSNPSNPMYWRPRTSTPVYYEHDEEHDEEHEEENEGGRPVRQLEEPYEPYDDDDEKPRSGSDEKPRPEPNDDFEKPEPNDDFEDDDWGGNETRTYVNSAFVKFVAPASGCAAVYFTYFEGEPSYDRVQMELYSATECNSTSLRRLKYENQIYYGNNRHIIADDRWLTPGRTYWVKVTAYEATGSLTVTDPCEPDVCPNDSACFAAEVSVGGEPVEIDNMGCHGESYTDLPFSGWYIKASAFASFIAPESGCAEIDYDAIYEKCDYYNDAEMSLYESMGCDVLPFTELAYSDNFDRTEPRIIIDDGSLTSGQRYFIMVDGRYCDQHTGTIEIKDPCDPSLCPNDSPCSAADGTVNGDSVMISTFGCTGETNTGTLVQSEDCYSNTTYQENTAFLSFIAPKSGCVQITFTFLEGEDFDDEVAMSLLRGDSCNTTFFYTLDHSDPWGGDPSIVMNNRDLVPGQRYWVMVYGNEGDEVIGLLKLSDPCGSACPNDSPCFASQAAVGGDPHYISTIGCHPERSYKIPSLSSEISNSAFASFMAPSTGCVELEFDFVDGVRWEDTDVEMALTYGDTCDAIPFSTLAYSDNKDEYEPRIIINDGSLMPGATYYVTLDGVYGDEVEGYLNVFDPCSNTTCPNDDPCNAVMAKVGGPRVPISTVGCTGEQEVDIPFSGLAKKTAYMSFIAPASGCVEIDFDYTYGFDFTFQFLMALYSATGCDSYPFAEEAYYLNMGGIDPRIKLDGNELVPGATYYVMVGEFQKGEEMSGTLEVTDPCA